VVWLATPRRRRTAAADRESDGARAAVLVLALGALLVSGEARAQSAWARGDAAWRRGDFAAADSQYSRRARKRRAPVEVLANRAAARAQQAPGDTAIEAELAQLGARDDRAGRMSAYNLGTLLGRRGETERALETLRRALERDPDDADTRFNYELVRRRLRDEQEQARRQRSGQQKQPEAPRPEPQAGQTGPGNPPPTPQSGAGSPPPQPAPSGGRAQRMTREQAERLLGSLSDLERVERMNARRTQAQRERRGRDW
jgi:tetratricopeptide (TPR) repeat protein